MAAVTRKHFERELDLEEISRLRLQGLTLREIALYLSKNRTYSLSAQTICNDLKEVQKRWQESSVRNLDEAKAQELARIDNLEREHWHGYRRLAPNLLDQAAACRFLDGVLKCSIQRAKLLGLESPTKIGIGQDPDAGPLEIKDATSELLGRIAGIAARTGESPGDSESDSG